MDFFDVIADRYSYRGMYQDIPVPRDHLRRIMEAGLAAPSGCNTQTTSLIGLDEPETVKAAGGLLGKPHFASAPAAIVVLTQATVCYNGRCFNVQDYGAAIENILLAVTALGYASCWVEGYITDAQAIGQKMGMLLGVPEGYEVVAYLPIGIPAQESGRAKYKAFAERAWFNCFGN